MGEASKLAELTWELKGKGEKKSCKKAGIFAI